MSLTMSLTTTFTRGASNTAVENAFVWGGNLDKQSFAFRESGGQSAPPDIDGAAAEDVIYVWHGLTLCMGGKIAKSIGLTGR
jgi:hypothetical protein